MGGASRNSRIQAFAGKIEGSPRGSRNVRLHHLTNEQTKPRKSADPAEFNLNEVAGRHEEQPISQAEIDHLFDADKRGLVVTLRDLKLVEEFASSDGRALVAPGSISTGSRQKGLLLAADWSTNPVYTSFALRATLATMGSYVFMTLTDWTEIHTCMITCVVTALAIAEERERKQTLRLVGAILGGLFGLAAVVFFIPRFDSLMGLLIVLGVGTAMAAWLSTGPKRYSYAGWQMGLAHVHDHRPEAAPVTELDVTWDRFVGIVVGVVAMRLAFAFPSIASRQKVQILTPMNWTLMQTMARHHDSRHGVSLTLC